MTEIYGMNQQVRLIDIVRLLYKKRNWIIGLCLLTGISAVIISLLKPNYYKSTTTFFAASDDLSSPEKIFGLTNAAMRYYGTDDDADRVLSIGQSSEFIDRIITKFDLFDHYEIDTSKVQFRLKTQMRFRKNYSIQRNKFNAIELSIEDKDQTLVADLTNYARFLLNDMTAEMIKSSQKIVMTSLSQEIDQQEALLLVISDSLMQMKVKYGIINPEIQGEKMAGKYDRLQSSIITDESKLDYLDAQRGNYSWKRDSVAKISMRFETNKALMARLDDPNSKDRFNLSTFTTGSNHILSLETFFSDIKNRLVQHKLRYQNVRSVYESTGQALIIVEQGSVPEKKSKPKRSIIVIGATFAAFIFSILGVMLYSVYAKIDWTTIKA
jgi:LPS O-antigen subunit length determinant protein (WzzB/FepE family)